MHFAEVVDFRKSLLGLLGFQKPFLTESDLLSQHDLASVRDIIF